MNIEERQIIKDDKMNKIVSSAKKKYQSIVLSILILILLAAILLDCDICNIGASTMPLTHFV